MSTTYATGGHNSAFMWGYVHTADKKRAIYVWGLVKDFTSSSYAVMDDFGNLVQIK
jgi:hypothetical protein